MNSQPGGDRRSPRTPDRAGGGRRGAPPRPSPPPPPPPRPRGGGAAGPGRGGGASAGLGNGTEVFLPLEDLVDVDRERARLAGEIRRLGEQLSGTEKKLKNEAFVTRAPADVVEREREKASTFRDQRDKLRQKLTALGGSG
jgi:hypothetical protein